MDDLWKQGLPNTNYTAQNASINILTLYLAILTLEPPSLLFIPYFPLGLLLLLHHFDIRIINSLFFHNSGVS